MTAIKRAIPAALAAVIAVVSGGLDRAQAGAASLKPLSPWDAQIYASAFDAAGRGDYAGAAAQAGGASDKSLQGRVELKKLLSADYKASFTELSAWLDRHGDLPGAERVYTLAKKRQPEGAPEPKAPSQAAVRSWDALKAATAPRPGERAPDRGQPARELFYSGDIKGAYDKATALGERWVAGLAAFRLKNYPEALQRFEAVARDGRENAWVRSGGAYWAARAAIASGSPELAPDFLRMAASHPKTFYGLIAERQLGLEPAAAPREVQDAIGAQLTRIAYDGGDGLAGFVRNDERARRAAALAQIGQIGEASLELRAGLAGSRSEEERRGWIALATALNAPMAALAADPFDGTDYPMPELSPRGGFTLDPALVYAIVRQESRFDPNARSHVGATGLMQLMPTTAADIAGDDRLKSDASPLRDPATNLRLGQDYFAWLLRRAEVDDCVLRAIAAYNGGSGTVLRTSKSLADDSDALMLIESLPYRETRDYVERVMAGYWIYRQMFGEDSPSLDAVASGARTVRLDRTRQAASAGASSMSLRASR
jgi:soluble lytic murein transglycosylase-like protein